MRAGASCLFLCLLLLEARASQPILRIDDGSFVAGSSYLGTPSIAVAPDGSLHVADSPDDQTLYYYRAENAYEPWTTELVLSTTALGDPVIRVRSDGVPVIAVPHREEQEIWFLERGGGSWQVTGTRGSLVLNRRIDFELGPNDEKIVAYTKLLELGVKRGTPGLYDITTVVGTDSQSYSRISAVNRSVDPEMDQPVNIPWPALTIDSGGQAWVLWHEYNAGWQTRIAPIEDMASGVTFHSSPFGPFAGDLVAGRNGWLFAAIAADPSRIGFLEPGQSWVLTDAPEAQRVRLAASSTGAFPLALFTDGAAVNMGHLICRTLPSPLARYAQGFAGAHDAWLRPPDIALDSGFNPYFITRVNGSSTVHAPVFRAAALGLGLSFSFGAPLSAVWSDMDGDFDADLVVLDSSKLLHLFERDGGALLDITPAPFQYDYFDAVATGDMDNDGDVDLVGLRASQLLLLRHNVGSWAVEVIGMTGGPYAVAPAIGDMDGDGWLDVIHSVEPNSVGASDRLYRNLRDGSFQSMSAPRLTVEASRSFDLLITDFDRDGDRDLLRGGISEFAEGLFINTGGFTFTGIWQSWFDPAGPYLSLLDIEIGYFHQSGLSNAWPSVVTFEPMLTVWRRSMVQSSRQQFASYGSALALGCIFNDPRPDVVFTEDAFGYGALKSINGPNGDFERITLFPFSLLGGKELLLNDFDGDGDLDALHFAEDAVRLLENRSDLLAAKNWLAVSPRGTHSNADGIGARVIPLASGSYLTPVEIHGSGGRFSSSRMAHLGLGSLTEIDQLRIEWPSGVVQELGPVSANQHILVSEPFSAPLLGGTQVQLSGPAGLQLEFDLVNSGGTLDVTLGDSGPPLPGSYQLAQARLPFFNISTDATFSGNVHLCFDYNELLLQVPEDQLRILHYDDSLPMPDWVDVTSSLDPVADRICADVTSLSPFVLTAPLTGTAVDDDAPLVSGPRLFANVPNPFNPSTRIHFELTELAAELSLDIFDVAGRRVRRLFHGTLPAGVHTLPWDGTNDDGVGVASGVYYCRLDASGVVRTRSICLVR